MVNRQSQPVVLTSKTYRPESTLNTRASPEAVRSFEVLSVVCRTSAPGFWSSNRR